MDKRVLLRGVMVLAVLAAWAVAAGPAAAQVKDVPHPFLLWTGEEAAAIRKRIETDAESRKQYERMRDYERGKLGPPGARNTTWLDLFEYSVLGDQAAGQRQLKALKGFIGARVPAPKQGDPASGNVHQRDDRTLEVLRYDVLYDLLSAEERKGVEETFRHYIDYQVRDQSGSFGRWAAKPRTAWLPNMQWPRVAGTLLMPVVMKDEALVKAMFEAPGGWKWYLDRYIADGQFYMEEFAKYYSNIGAMFLYCEGLERIGLPQYGYGYTGTGAGQATMRKFAESIWRIGYPRYDVPGGMADYYRVAMGDARGGWGHTNVRGCLPGEQPGTPRWQASRMNGPLPKALAPLWAEWLHKRWPEAGFDYFLAQMREPGEDFYYPTLYLGLSPIDSRKVKGPAWPSIVSGERGFALLKMDETADYWESPRPAAALQFAMYYVHYTHDCFALLGYTAFNRPIYVNQGGVAQGYGGGSPWQDSVRGHHGIVVDNQQAQFVDDGESGSANTQIRQGLYPSAKFLAIRAKEVYRDVDQTRALVLTDQYLLDVNRLVSDRPRVYDFNLHAVGVHTPEDAAKWKPSTDLDGGVLWEGTTFAEKVKASGGAYDIRKTVKQEPGDRPWTFKAVQSCALEDPAQAKYPKAWYDRQVGVRVTVLPDPLAPKLATAAYAGETPYVVGKEGKHQPPETGSTTLLVRRTAPSTTFVAVHEPFEKNAPKIDQVATLAAGPNSLALSVRGAAAGVDDRIFLALGDGHDKPQAVTVAAGAGAGDSITFTDHAWVRIGREQVEAFGNISALALAVEGAPKLLLNGRPTSSKITDGRLVLTP